MMLDVVSQTCKRGGGGGGGGPKPMDFFDTDTYMYIVCVVAEIPALSV